MSTQAQSTTKKKAKFEEIFTGRSYVGAIGRRKSAIAQVRVYVDGKGRMYINESEYRKYFPTFQLQKIIAKPLDILKQKQEVDISIHAKGGGLHGQAEAIALGLARALLKLEPESKSRLRQGGLLTRDSRVKERKKPGLKRARRAPQWAKR